MKKPKRSDYVGKYKVGKKQYPIFSFERWKINESMFGRTYATDDEAKEAYIRYLQLYRK